MPAMAITVGVWGGRSYILVHERSFTDSTISEDNNLKITLQSVIAVIKNHLPCREKEERKTYFEQDLLLGCHIIGLLLASFVLCGAAPLYMSW